MRSEIKILLLVLIWLSSNLINTNVKSQEPEKINWITFEQLEDSLKVNPKKVFIDFYADWCKLCKEMQKNVFTETEVIETLNKEYYSVRMNVESSDTIVFGGQTYVNERLERRNPVHQIPLLMATQQDKPFSLPAMIFLDENFIATERYFQYIDKESFVEILKTIHD